MKSFFRKLSVVFLVLVLAVIVGFKSVQSQTVATSSVSPSGQIDKTLVEDLNRLPSVEISNLILSKVDYVGGETISGSFTIQNDRDYNLPGLVYRVSLAGKYVNDLAGIYYDSQTFGPIFLGAKENKKIDFTYVIPKLLAGDDLRLQIRAFTSSGAPLSWTDKPIKVSGTMMFADISSAYVEIDGQKFSLQAGPGLNPDRAGSINVKLDNNTKKELVIYPKLSVYERSTTGKLLKSVDLKSIVIPVDGESSVKAELDNFNNNPGVYEGNLDFFNSAGDKIAPSLPFRYLVIGDTVAIQYVTSDKYEVAKGDEFNLRVGYTGAPDDIISSSRISPQPLNLSVVVLNENNLTISEHKSKFDFNTGLSTIIPLKAKISAQSLSVKITVTDDTGRVVTTYSNNISQNNIENKLISTPNSIWTGIIALILGLIVILVLIISKRKRLKTYILIAIVLTSALGFFNITEANSFQVIDAEAGGASAISISSLSSPNNTLYPGQSFRVNGSVTTLACTNTPQSVFGYWSSIKTESEPFFPSLNVSYNNNGTIHNFEQWNPSQHGFTNYTNDFSIGNEGQNYIAPSTPGVYRIYMKVVVDWGDINSSVWGYIDFEVVPPPSPNITNASCVGTSGSLTWDPVSIPGVSYAIRIDKSPDSWANSCSTFNAGDSCGSTTNTNYSFTGASGATYKAWVHSIVNGVWSNPTYTSNFTCTAPPPPPPLTASCYGSPASGSAPLTVTWTATASGGTGPYTYTNWTGTDGLSGNGISVSKQYTTNGDKYATTTVSDSAGNTKTVGCSGMVSNSGCNGNCVRISSVVNGSCVVGGSYSSIPTNPSQLCLDGTPTAVSGGASGPWSWDCLGSGTGHTDAINCTATKSVTPTGINCTIQRISPDPDTYPTVPINTPTEWRMIPGGSTTESELNNATKSWTISENGQDYLLPNSNVRTITPTFITVGQKIMKATADSSSCNGLGVTFDVTLDGGAIKEN